MKLVSASRKRGISLAVTDVFRNPVLASQAQLQSSPKKEQADQRVEPFSLLGNLSRTDSVKQELSALCHLDESKIEDAYPCTPLQEGLLSLTGKRAGDYTMQAVLELAKDADIVAFKKSWETAMAVTPILRTRIVHHSQLELTQVVCQDAIEWREAEHLDAYLQEDKSEPMGLGDRLSRFALINEGSDRPRFFVWTMHHALYDGWSLPLVVELAGKAYKGISPEKRTDFSLFVKQTINGRDADAKAYWQSYLANGEFVQFPSLPTSTQKPVADATVEDDFHLETKTDVTASSLIRGALAILLQQHTGSRDVVFGATVSGRNAPVAGIEEIIGPTIATVPVRVQVPDRSTVSEFLNDIQQQATEMIAYEQTGLRGIAKMDDSCNSACGFQTLLVVQPDEELQTEDVLGTWRTATQQEGFSTYPLTLECILGVHEVKVRASFDSGIIPKWHVEYMVQQLGAILAQLSRIEPDQSVGDIETLSLKDKSAVWKWNQSVPEPVDACLHNLVDEQAKLRPDSPSVSAWDGELTYGQLKEYSSLLARRLVDLGVGREVIVPLCFEKSKWTTVAMVAVLKAGGAFLLLDPTQIADDRRDRVIADTGAKILLASVQYADLISGPERTVVTVSAEIGDWAPSVTDTKEYQCRPPIQTDSAAYVIFTSGSTGQPKGIVIDHRAACTSFFYHGQNLGFDVRTRILQFSSYTFDACILETFTPLLFGGCVCVPSDGARVADLGTTIQQMGVTTAVLTPAVARLLEPASLLALTTMILCGEKPTEKDIQQWSALPRLYNGYGPAECTVCCSINDAKANPENSHIGRAVASLAWIVDAEDHHRLVPVGVVGELLVEGPILAREYINDPGKTAASFIEAPKWLLRGSDSTPGRQSRLYKTGDLVRYNEDGSMTFLGRKDTQVKIRGQRLELGEVEHHVRDCLGSNVQVIADIVKLQGDNESKMLAAFVSGLASSEMSSNGTCRLLSILDEGVDLIRLSSDVEKSLSQKLPSYMMPVVYFLTSKMPLSASGKVDRKRLQKMGDLLSAKDLADFKTAEEGKKRQPETEEEVLLRDIWARVLHIDASGIGLDDSFVQLGGDSISAMMVVGDARKLGLELGVADVLHQSGLQHVAGVARRHVRDASNAIPHTEYQGAVEQSFAQGRLWFLDQLYPDSTLYLMPYTMRFRGPLRLDALQAALLALENRHETLRTTFTSENDINLQIIRPFQPHYLTVTNLTSGDKASLAQVLHQEQTMPFNLVTDPGWRVSVYKLDEEDHILSIVMHHIISDGWSAGILYRELATFYSAALRGQDPLSQTDQLSIQYRDYALWQRQPDQLAEHQKQLKYWVNQLENSQPAELLCDKPRPASLSGNAKILELKVEGSLYRDLQRFCREREVTQFVALLAAFRATHYRLTGSKDATIGTANANRDRWQLKDMIGFFVNMQCLRIKVDEDSFEQLVREVQGVTRASLENQDVPFEEIVARLKNTRDMSRQPLVQIVFTLHSKSDLRDYTLEGVETEHMEVALSSRFDIEFHFTQEDDCLKGEVAFSTDLFHEKTVESMIYLFQNVLEQCLKEPHEDIESLPLTAGDPRSLHDGLIAAEIEQTESPRGSNVIEVFKHQAKDHPQRTAIKDATTQLTYAQLDACSDKIAHWLNQRMPAQEQLIGVYAGRSCLTLVAFLGIMKANLAYVPLDIRSPLGRVESIISSIEGRRLVLLGPGTQPPNIELDDTEFVSIQEMLQQVQHEPAQVSTPSSTSLAYVMFTSGSTGNPKGVMINHRGILRLVKDNDLVQYLPRHPIMAHMGSMAFDITTWEIYASLLNGGTLVCIDTMEVLNNEAMADIFAREKIQTAILTPALLKQYLIDTPQILSGLEVLLVGGDKADGEDLVAAQKVMNGKVINAYGPTENTVVSTFYCLPDDCQYGTRLPIGRALSNSGAYVVDRSLRQVPVGVIGELVVTGDGLARGYIDTQQDVNRFVMMLIDGQRVRAYRTGDYVRCRPVDGELEFFGRMDGQLKIRGQRVELGEIETNIRSHYSVIDAVVVPQQVNDQVTQLAGFVTILEEEEQQGQCEESGDDGETQHVELWETLFNSEKYTTVGDLKPEKIGRDFTAWTSMYDGTLIDDGEMNEWLDDTIRTMLNGEEPGNVLELGTGTGMMLFNLGKGLQNYVGLEPTEKAIAFVAEAAKLVPGLKDKLYLQKGTATDVSRLKKLNSPNLVVINSVAQYFPSQSYLSSVVEDLVRLQGVKTIFFGDMRSFALYKHFQVTKALYRFGERPIRDDVKRQMAETEDDEQELLVDPGFFTALQDQLPGFIEHVEILPKRMKATNELSCYRYAAVLHVKDAHQPRNIHDVDKSEWVDFMEQGLDRDSLLRLLVDNRSKSSFVPVSNIPNKKSIVEKHVVSFLESGSSGGLDWLPSTKKDAEACSSLSALDLEEIALEVGYRVEVSWSRQHSLQGGLDAIFHHLQPSTDETRVLFRFPTDHHGRLGQPLTSRPLHTRLKQRIRYELQESLRERLPSYMVPQSITVLEKLPINDNGKVDRKALANSITKTFVLQGPKKQPMSPAERQLQSIWGKVLFMDTASIGLEDNFFQLGGNSIEAMKVVGQARKKGMELTVADIFKHPTLIAQAQMQATKTVQEVKTIGPFDLIGGYEGTDKLRKELATLCKTDESSLEDAYPCTPLQEGLLSLTAKGQNDYIMQAVFEISDRVDLDAFEKSWEEVVQSTAILRTRIVQHEKLGLTQVVCKEHWEWRHGKQLQEYLEEDKKMQMGLGDGLSHAALIITGEDSTQRFFVWTIHHALYDGWSLPRIVGHVSDIYHGKIKENKPASFNSFVRYVQGVRDLDVVTYWRSYLADAEFSAFPALPASVQQPVADEVLEASLTARLKSDVTVSTVIRGALGVLISQYMNSSDVVFGAVVSGRNAPVPGIEDIVGPTIATVPIRVQVKREQLVLEYLQALQGAATQMMEYEQTGLQRIANVGDDGRRGCSFQTLLVIQPQAENVSDETKLGEWRAIPAQQKSNTTYAMVLECLLGADDAKLRVSFDSRIVSRRQVESMIQQLDAISGQLAQPQANQTIGEINTLTLDDERRIWEWNKQVPDAVERHLHDLISTRVELKPESPAICGWDGDLTYKELDHLSSKLAYHLVENLGLRQGAAVPVCFEKSIWMFVAMMGVIKAGGAFLPVDVTQGAERRNQIISDTNSNLILASFNHTRSVTGPHRTVFIVCLESLASLPPAPLAFNSGVAVTSPAYIMFTSGSTGQPKGIAIGHRAVSTCCIHIGRAAGFNNDTRTLQFASCTFDAVILEIFVTLVHGGCVCIPRDNDILTAERAINDMGVNMSFLTPTVARLLEPSQVPCLSTILLGGEKMTNEDFQRWSPTVKTLNVYGPTECTVMCAADDSEAHLVDGCCIGRAVGSTLWIASPENHNQLVPVGAIGELLVEGATLAQGYLNLPEQTSASFISDPAWLVRGVHGGHTGRHGRVYKTGDLVRYNENGTVTYIGRKDTQVKIRGQRLELSEVEHQVRACVPSVDQAIAEVTQLSSDEKKEVLSVFVTDRTSKGDGHCEDDSVYVVGGIAEGVELIWLKPEYEAVLSRRLPGYMVPTVYLRLSNLPLMSSGKVNRKALRAIASDLSPQSLAKIQQAARGTRRAPKTPTEQVLRDLWSQALHIEPEAISLDDSFSALGGDSITAMKLVVSARKAGLVLAMMDIFKYDSLASLAEHEDSVARRRRVHPAADVEPFALVDPDIRAGILKDAKSALEPLEVTDVYPLTGFQKNVVEMSQVWPRQSLNYIFLDFGVDLNVDRLIDACSGLVQHYPLLRSVIINSGGVYFQAISKNMVLPVSISDATEDLSMASHNLCLADTQSGFQFGQPLTSFMLIRSKSEGSRLVIRLSHAQYDGVLLPSLLGTLLDLYQGNVPRPVADFAEFMWHKRSQRAASLAYWQHLLQGSNVTKLPHILPQPTSKRSSTTELTNAKSIVLEKVVGLPQVPEKATLASIISAGWATVLSHITGQEDVVYGSLVAGRDVGLSSAGVIAGPCVNIVPVRAQVSPRKSPLGLLLSLQEQNHAAQSHSMDLADIIKESTNWAMGTDFDSVVQHQGVDETPELRVSKMSVKVRWFENPYHTSPRLMVMSYPMGDSVKIKLLANSCITTPEIVKTLLDGLCESVSRLLMSEQQSLSSCKPSIQL